MSAFSPRLSPGEIYTTWATQGRILTQRASSQQTQHCGQECPPCCRADIVGKSARRVCLAWNSELCIEWRCMTVKRQGSPSFSKIGRHLRPPPKYSKIASELFQILLPPIGSYGIKSHQGRGFSISTESHTDGWEEIRRLVP